MSAASSAPFRECPVHHWFGLTYSSYLVLPRLALESMPDEWKIRFVELLEEMEASLDYESPEYAVFTRRWGGTDAEFDEMVRSVLGNRELHEAAPRGR